MTLALAAEHRPDEPAVVFTGAYLASRELGERAATFARGPLALGPGLPRAWAIQTDGFKRPA